MSQGRPNLLFLMCDQMQAQVLEQGHPCLTPHLDRLAAEGVRVCNAYTPNAICSPARASLMTGLLPHNHGVLSVTHTQDSDQLVLRRDRRHWAQHLAAAGYHTGYFGKWHVEHSEQPADFGWHVDGSVGSDAFKQRAEQLQGEEEAFSHDFILHAPEGYRPTRFFGVSSSTPQQRRMGTVTSLARDYLHTALSGEEPWCCFVSTNEPHDPFICGEQAARAYRSSQLPLPASHADPMTDKPGLYNRSAGVWRDMDESHRRMAAACYYGSISEIDTLYGELIQQVRDAGKMDDTIVIMTSDHGELLGAHRMYCKNISAFEEIYRVPLIVAGPGIAAGAVSDARVGLHDLHPTILELAGLSPDPVPDSRSAAALLASGARGDGSWRRGYAEYFGVRILLTQRVVWDGDTKYIFNGFDNDELYDLAADPHEMTNLAARPQHRETLHRMAGLMWDYARRTKDHTLLRTDYAPLRLAPVGPN